MTRDASRSRRSLPVIAALTTLAATTLSACSWMSPVQTDEAYSGGDGVAVQLGKVAVTDLLLVSSAKGAPGTVVGQVTNRGDEDVQLTVGTGGSGGTAKTIPAHGVLKLQDAGITVPSVDVAPGSLTTLTLSTPATGAEQTTVPVLAAEGNYATVTPSASATPTAATPATTASATAKASGTASATPSKGVTAHPAATPTKK